MTKKSKRRIAVRIDMTPMVDIAFLLLIFYMTTTQFKPPEQKQVVLPTSTSQRQLPLKNFITITVTKQDSVFLDYILKVKKFDPTIADSIELPEREYLTSTPEGVGNEIQKMRLKAISQNIKDLFLVMKADKDASFGVVEKIMKAMQDQNLTSFQVVTDLDRTLSRTVGGG
ncbi:MAG: biopolymer transporter ExbD [candidate division Zixibacteria bacterium]|nr:biopolymer transporter ExbD [candidate division Zixibacteria bacterium]